MNRFAARGALTRACLPALAVLLFPLATPAPARSQDCYRAYFEIAPDYPFGDTSWRIPSPPNDTWTEVHPNPGAAHHQDEYLDFDHDGLIDKVEAILEAGVTAPWCVAAIGTVLRIVPVTFDETGQPVPSGEVVTAWWPDYVYRCNGVHCPDPDTLTVLEPDFGRVIDIWAHVGTWPHYDFPVHVGEYLISRDADGAESWYRVEGITCGLIVAPDLATSATRTSWGALKSLYR